MAYMGFDALKSKLANRPGVTNPGALSAAIGRRKYGSKKFNAAASSGQSLRGAHPVVQHVINARAKRRKAQGDGESPTA